MPPKALPKKKVKKSASGKGNEEELNEEFDVFLTIYNPYVSQNCVEFDQKSKCFKPIFDFKKPVVYYRSVGSTKQRLEGSYGIVYEEVPVPKDKSSRDSFNLLSVETQNTLVYKKDQNECTDPNLYPVLKFQGTASKSEIQAAYEEHEKKMQKEKDENDATEHWFKGDLKVLLKFTGRRELVFHEKNLKYLRLCERVLDQNMTEANLDYSFYDNPSDEVKPDSGSLLPLWRLSCERTKGVHVTDLGWSPQHADLLAVGGGGGGHQVDGDDLDLEGEKGFVCVYSLKGPAHPEKTIESPEGVSCVSFHPQLRHLLAVAFTGGTVAVYDIRGKDSNLPPQGRDSKFQALFHQDRVAEIEWFPDPVPQKFCSISFDGKLINWSFLVNDLFPADLVTELKVKDWPLEDPSEGLEMDQEPEEDENLGLNSCGTTISVNPTEKDAFLVGTETGLVHRGSFEDKRCYGDGFSGHTGQVQRVCWNRLHPRVFISCSTDFTLQVWDHTYDQSVFEFFFELAVQDVAWAPYSTTVFAAITSRSMVSVFDLSLNKQEAVGSCTVYTKKQNIALTRISFHPNKPVIAVGDERGCVTIFKLSPNVRSSLKAMKTVEKSKFVTGEIAKMDRLLAAAKVEPKN